MKNKKYFKFFFNIVSPQIHLHETSVIHLWQINLRINELLKTLDLSL